MMQPYQQASEEILRQSKEPGKAIGALAKTATGLTAGLAGGGAILNRIMPFLSKYIDPDLAVKGLNKIDPRFGKFVSGALGQGMSVEDIGSFIKEKVTGEKPQEEQQAKQPQQPKNIIEEYSPEVHEILVDKIGQGLKPLAVAFQLANDAKFKRPIEELQKKTGKSFSDLVSAVFGGQESEQQPNQPQQAQQQDPRQMAQQMIAQHQQQQPQQGGVNQQLMQALQMAAQSRQRRQPK